MDVSEEWRVAVSLRSQGKQDNRSVTLCADMAVSRFQAREFSNIAPAIGEGNGGSLSMNQGAPDKRRDAQLVVTLGHKVDDSRLFFRSPQGLVAGEVEGWLGYHVENYRLRMFVECRALRRSSRGS
jgi:hypothetical protein